MTDEHEARLRESGKLYAGESADDYHESIRQDNERSTNRMQEPTIFHPTGRANFVAVTVGPLELWFSYQTIIAFRDARQAQRGARVIRNYWSTTTGGHLNHIDNGNKATRLDASDFELELGQALEGFESVKAEG